MFYVLAILLVTLGVVGLFLKKNFTNPVLKFASSKIGSISLISIGVFFWFVNGIYFWNPAGTATAIQYMTGGDKMIKTQGLKMKWWGKTIPIKYEISIKDLIFKKTDEDGRLIMDLDDSPGLYNRQAHLWEFQDAIKAEIAVSVIAGIDMDDEEKFLSMADKNGSEKRLIKGRILPNIDAALKNTCKLMDAQDYISGKASDFDRYFKDQLQNGMYLVEEYSQTEEAPEIIGDTSTVRKLKSNVSSSRQKKFRIKRDALGNIIRDKQSNSLAQYGISIQQAIVTGIDWESSFDQRLQLQKEQVAQTQLEKQEAEKEFYRAKKEIAKGESEKAKERARLEKEQIQQTIEAETRAKVAVQNLIAEKKQYEVEQFKAKSKKVAADAQYYENAKLVSAGLTPQERAEWEYKTAVGVAQQIKELSLPSTYISGSEKGNNSNLLQSLIGADLAKRMMTKEK
jgi:regulator of protease activity HflC (stomatin/prohibitin superfamily)